MCVAGETDKPEDNEPTTDYRFSGKDAEFFGISARQRGVGLPPEARACGHAGSNSKPSHSGVTHWSMVAVRYRRVPNRVTT
jgi:hypothetical protein